MTTSQKSRIKRRPPADTLRVSSWNDLPDKTQPARYEICTGDGVRNEITLAKGNRVVLEALINGPVLCASPVRISDRVHILKSEYGVPITKEMYSNDAATGRARFGVYFIGSGVRRLGGGAA